ncbi:MAG TPA: condensation domain-containing protein, partial [Thermoanaerobaculia bacterium]
MKLSAQAGQLSCYAQKGALTRELQEGIVRFKPELIALLESRSAAEPQLFPLSAGQKGLYILQKLQPASSAYNVPLCFRFNADIDARVLAAAWDRVLDRFPILTARVVERDGAPYQQTDVRCRTTLQRRDIAFTDDEQLLSFLRNEAKQPFDLFRGPLTRIELFVPPNRKPILLLTVHHIVFDG